MLASAISGYHPASSAINGRPCLPFNQVDKPAISHVTLAHQSQEIREVRYARSKPNHGQKTQRSLMTGGEPAQTTANPRTYYPTTPANSRTTTNATTNRSPTAPFRRIFFPYYGPLRPLLYEHTYGASGLATAEQTYGHIYWYTL